MIQIHETEAGIECTRLLTSGGEGVVAIVLFSLVVAMVVQHRVNTGDDRL